MKLKKDFVTGWCRDAYLLTGTEKAEFKGILTGNATTAFVIECLKEQTDREDIIKKMSLKYDAPKSIIEEDVDKVLDALKNIGAVED